jgi:hypothetical protein
LCAALMRSHTRTRSSRPCSLVISRIWPAGTRAQERAATGRDA